MDLTILASLVIITSLVVNGVYQVTEYGMLLHFLRKWSGKLLGDKWSMPLFTCVTCMAGSVWNIVILFGAIAFGYIDVTFAGIFPLLILNGLISAFMAMLLRVFFKACERIANNSIEDSINKLGTKLKK